MAHGKPLLLTKNKGDTTMKILIATINDNHSGEAYWEGWTVRIPVEDSVFDKIVGADQDIYFADDFVKELIDQLPRDWNDLTLGGDAQIQVWVNTEPSAADRADTIWDEATERAISDAYYDQELTVDVATLTMSIRGADPIAGWCIPNN
jgi:hypothetical protein